MQEAGQSVGKVIKRRDERLDVTWTSHMILIHQEDMAVPCRVANVSTGGTLVECYETCPSLSIQDELILVIDDLGEFAAEVAWLCVPYIGLKIMAGPDLLLKSYAEASRTEPKRSPLLPDG